LQENAHLCRKERMIAVILVSMPNRHERRTKRALSAFRYDDEICLGQIGGKPAEKGEFESARPGARFGEAVLAAPHLVRKAVNGLFRPDVSVGRSSVLVPSRTRMSRSPYSFAT